MIIGRLKRYVPLTVKAILSEKYSWCRLRYQSFQFDMYRKGYDRMSFGSKKKKASEWIRQFPEQSHFKYEHVDHWLKKYVPMPANILEIGGWRGDLARVVLAEHKNILKWHNYDLLECNHFQKCSDNRYKLITLDDYLWKKSLNFDYNALIATHMIEHIKWRELKDLIRWIPGQVATVLFEAPLPRSAENMNWKGDHSSHILEKGWEQVAGEMKNNGFSVDFSADNTYIFVRNR